MSNYEVYLEEGTRSLIEILLSIRLNKREVENVVEVFTDELMNNIVHSEQLRSCRYLVYDKALKIVDKYIDLFLGEKDATYQDFESAIAFCEQKKEILRIYKEQGWKVPQLDALDVESSKAYFLRQIERLSITSKIEFQDDSIEDLLRKAQSELSVEACDGVADLVEEMYINIEYCKEKNIKIPEIKNKDKKRLLKHIEEIKRIAVAKTALHKDIIERDYKISDFVSRGDKDQEQWKELLELCKVQNTQMSECSKRKWPLPNVLYSRPALLIEKYTHFIEMVTLDEQIALHSNISDAVKNFFTMRKNCQRQIQNIKKCHDNNWIIPALIINDPSALLDSVEQEKNRRKRRLLNKICVGIGCIFVVALIVGGIWSKIKSREGKIKIPFESEYAYGHDVDEIVNQLNELGFENIEIIESFEGWLGDNKIIQITIDEKSDFQKGKYVYPEVNIAILCSSRNRTDITDILNNWKNENYSELYTKLKNAGFENVFMNESSTSNRAYENKIAQIEIGENIYTKGDCHVPMNTCINIQYYTLKYRIGYTLQEFVGLDYKDIVQQLSTEGFTNISYESTNQGWQKNDTIVSVLINGITNFNKEEEFRPDVPIRIVYSGGENRINITEIIQSWNTDDYATMCEKIRSSGLTEVRTYVTQTVNKSYNQKIAKIEINGQQYISGACYPSIGARILIAYYNLIIQIGKTETEFINDNDKDYSDVVKELENKGFTNIQLYRNDELILGIVAKERSIASISIGNRHNYLATDEFQFDTPIVIVVNTFKNEEYEGINHIMP